MSASKLSCVAIAILHLISNQITAIRAADFYPAKCGIVIAGEIRHGDTKLFRDQVAGLLKKDCEPKTIYLYSPGGAMSASLEIAEMIYALQLKTVGPALRDRETNEINGPRICSELPGSADRAAREAALAHKHFEAWKHAMENNAKWPALPRLSGDFDPSTGNGDPRCTCASACFFMWAAGAQREADIALIHRPYFDPTEFAALDAASARTRYQQLENDSRAFLSKVGVQTATIERMFSIDSQSADYLTQGELRSLRMAPHWSELKLGKCGPEPQLKDQSAAPDNYQGEYAELTPQERRWFIARAKREICWRAAQKELRKSLIEEFQKGQRR